MEPVNKAIAAENPKTCTGDQLSKTASKTSWRVSSSKSCEKLATKDDIKATTAQKCKKVEPPAATKASLARENFIRKSSNFSNKTEPPMSARNGKSSAKRFWRNKSNASNISRVTCSSQNSQLPIVSPITRGKSFNALLTENQEKFKKLEKETSKLSEKTLPQLWVTKEGASRSRSFIAAPREIEKSAGCPISEPFVKSKTYISTEENANRLKNSVATPKSTIVKPKTSRFNSDATSKEPNKMHVRKRDKSVSNSCEKLNAYTEAEGEQTSVGTPHKSKVLKSTNIGSKKINTTKKTIKTNMVVENFDSDTEVGGEIDLEQKALLDLKRMESKIMKTLGTCIQIARKNTEHDFDMFLSNMEKKEPLEKLKLMIELVEKFCEQNLHQKTLNKQLQQEVKELLHQNTLFGEQIQHYKTFSFEIDAQDSKQMHGRAEETTELKKQLEEIKAELKRCKMEPQENNFHMEALEDYRNAKHEAERLQNELQNVKNQCKEELECMKLQLNDLKATLEIKNAECEEANRKARNYISEIAKLENEASEIMAERKRGSEKIVALEQEVLELNEKLKEMKELKTNIVEVIPEAVEKELKRYKQAQEEKRRELDNLKQSLTDARYTVTKLESENTHLKNLIEVRAAHITTVENNCSHQRAEMAEMINCLNEKNHVIGQLNDELHEKNEEFQRMFSTLGQKQIDLTQQLETVKLLKESYERSQHLRVIHEEKIALLEDEINKLKDERLRKEQTTSPDMDCFEERRKRHKKNINVKKYST